MIVLAQRREDKNGKLGWIKDSGGDHNLGGGDHNFGGGDHNLGGGDHNLGGGDEEENAVSL